MPTFNHYDLKLFAPHFDSKLVDVVNELEHLRRLRLGGTSPAPVFFQLKSIFHMLESIGSARIEGNHTTLADYIENGLEPNKPLEQEDHMREIQNIENAMEYIEESIKEGSEITGMFIRELHNLAVKDLIREGDQTPGKYRSKNVAIAESDHLPPDHLQVQKYMDELVGFINNPDPNKYDLIKVAMAHHRFGWVHPFGNGNGRVVRLLTYAMLLKFGFNVDVGGRVLNPTAVFCNDRDMYYEMLSKADKGSSESTEEWCIYVLDGILNELKKLDSLADFDFLNDKILLPALEYAKERKLITVLESEILQIAAKNGITKLADYEKVMKGMTRQQRTYQLKKLVSNKMLIPIKDHARQYVIGFGNSYLIRGVIDSLSSEGFISLDK